MRTKLLTVLIISLLLSSCVDKQKQENKLNEEKQASATNEAENSKLKISELPLGFKFGMSILEVDEQIKKLINDSILKVIKKDEEFEYNYTTKKGDKITYWIEFGFYENELYKIYLDAISPEVPSNSSDYTKIFTVIDNELDATLDTSYLKVGYVDELAPESKYYINKWFKGNQIILLRKDNFSCELSYINAPVDKIIFDKNVKQSLEDARDGQKYGKVKNSSWDGSVSQVKSYLKKNLNDPDSYESIEWSEVSKTNDGYIVRHKYRAKNCFGGYVIENQIFYIDKKGNITNVVDYK